MIETIFLDMDGVIADLNGWYNNVFGLNCRDDPNKYENWTKGVKSEMFINFRLMPNADKLISYLLNSNKNIVILSSKGNNNDHMEVERQKKIWLENQGLGMLKAIFVNKKVEKSYYATKTSLLIDDSIECIEPFIKKGGYGILHTSVEKTLKRMEYYNANSNFN